jgi:enoyl-CoA hydratase/carnithine racemase
MTSILPPVTGIRWTLNPDGIGVITLSRPPVNALNRELRRASLRLIEALDGDAPVRVILIDSELERAFCVGPDLHELSTDHAR